jgi:hypothetical protein
MFFTGTEPTLLAGRAWIQVRVNMPAMAAFSSNSSRIYTWKCDSVYVSIPVIKHDVDYIFIFV